MKPFVISVSANTFSVIYTFRFIDLFLKKIKQQLKVSIKTCWLVKPDLL